MRKVYIILLTLSSIHARHDVLLEFKGAYFLPTSSTFRHSYGNGGALYGPELTFKLYKGLYGWLSIDFLTKNRLIIYDGPVSGAGVSACCQTLACQGYSRRLLFMPLAGGLKYFVPFCNRNGWLAGDFYLGLGIEPTYVHKKSTSPYTHFKQSTWGVGVIGKVGSYFMLPHHFFIDTFIDYSGVWAVRRRSSSYGATGTNLSGCIFGVGLGYRFN